MLEFREVTVRYGAATAVENLSLALRPGELLTLLGPSGCGKSTLIRTAGGFMTPAAGRIWLDGADVTNLPPEARPTATVFQSHALFPHKNVGDNVAYGLRARGVPRAEAARRAVAMLEKVGLDGVAARPVQALSGGQQQRVALARALVVNPKVLLLDEPLSSLDAGLRVQLRAEIRRLQRVLGMTALYVTHDQEEALSISDRVAVMRSGRLVQVGTPEAIYGRPADEFVARFVGDAHVLPAVEGGAVFVRPGDLEPDPASPVRGRVTERQFKGATVTYVVDMAPDAPDMDVPDASGARRVFARVAGRELRVDIRTPEARPLAVGDETGLRATRNDRENRGLAGA